MFHRVLFFLLLFLLPTQLGYHAWPEWSMVLGRRIDYLSPTLYLTDIVIFSLLVSWCMGSLRSIKEFVLGIKVLISKILHTKYIILLILFPVVNIFFAANTPVTLYKWTKVVEFMLLGWYVVKTKPSFSLVTLFLSGGLLFSSLLAIVQFFLQHSVDGVFWFLGERTFAVDTPGIARTNWCWVGGSLCKELIRPYATFPHPNVLAGFIVGVLSLVLSHVRYHLKWFYIITLVAGIITLFLTFSRSAWMVGGLIGLIAWWKNTGVWKGKISRVFLLGLLLALVGLFLWPQFQLLTPDSESVVVRQELARAAITLWSRSPFIGIGLGNFLTTLPSVLYSRGVYFLQPVHNIYLLLLTETGIVGLGLFCWFLIRTLRYPQRYPGVVLGLGGLLLLGLVDHYLFTLQQGQLLLTIFLSLLYDSSRA